MPDAKHTYSIYEPPHHAGKVIEARRFESFAANTGALIQGTPPYSGLASGMRADSKTIRQRKEDEKDPEYAENKKHWQKFFGIEEEPAATWPQEFDLEPGKVNYISNGVELKNLWSKHSLEKLPILETMVGSLEMPAKDVLKELGYDDPEVLRQQRMDENGR